MSVQLVAILAVVKPEIGLDEVSGISKAGRISANAKPRWRKQ